MPEFDPMGMLGAAGRSVGNAVVNGPSNCAERGQYPAKNYRPRLAASRRADNIAPILEAPVIETILTHLGL